MTFDQVLGLFRDNRESNTHLGKNFEYLMQAWLRTTSQYNFKEVWMWYDFPLQYRKQICPPDGNDKGIDLVALDYDDKYWAIQCKCHNEKHLNGQCFITKECVDHFLGAIKRPFTDKNEKENRFIKGIFIATLNKWLVDNASSYIDKERTLFFDVDLVTLKQLEAVEDWNELLDTISDKLSTRIIIEKWFINLFEKVVRKDIEPNDQLFCDPNHKVTFTDYIEQLKRDLRPSINENEPIELLAQHIIAKPILDALFNNNNYLEHNHIYQAWSISLNSSKNKVI